MGADNHDYVSKSIISVGDTFSHTGYGPGGGGAGFSHFDTKFEEKNILNYGTMSYQRFMMKKLVLQEFPETSLGGLTWGFMDALYEGVKDIRSDADKIKSKTLILQAEHDDYVHPSGQKTVCDRINKKTPGLCKLEVFRNAKHELLLERDTIRTKVLTMIYDFLFK
jgi:esterase/lipase